MTDKVNGEWGATMNEKFFDLKKEKQDRMINAALKVFGENGYKRASTDEMVKEAEISKGLLFHYFISKQGLYEFVFDYSIRYMTMELSIVANSKETNYFELYKQILLAKMSVLKIYPDMQKFLNSVMQENQQELPLDIVQKRYDFQEYYRGILGKADFERFLPEIDIEKMNNMMEYTINGLMEEYIDPERMVEEAIGYLSMMEKICLK